MDADPASRASAWARPGIVVALLLAYLAVHAAVRLAMWPTLGIDDAEQTLFAQQWQWSYRFRAPPLFTWLLLPLQQLFGPGVVAVTVLRYLLLGVTLLCTWLVARRLIADPRLAALATLSFATVYVFGYYSHHDLTHTTMMATLLAASWWQFVRLCAAPTAGGFALLGVLFGLGLLGKWNFVMFPPALWLACLATPAYRHLALDRRGLLTVAATVLVPLPTLLFVLGHAAPLGAIGSEILGEQAGFVATLGTGTGDLLLAVAAYPQPFLLLFVACLGTAAWRGLRRPDRAMLAPTTVPDTTLVGRVMLIGLGLHWLLVPLAGATTFSERWLQPALMTLPIWLFMLVERGVPGRRALAAYTLLTALLVLAIPGLRYALYARGADHCGSCRAMVPFKALATGLVAAGYDGRGTVLASGFHVGGNLRVRFPDARVVDSGYAPTLWPAPRDRGPCLLVWSMRDADDLRGRAPLLDYLGTQLAGSAGADHVEGLVAAPMFGSRTRIYRLGYRLYSEGSGQCR